MANLTHFWEASVNVTWFPVFFFFFTGYFYVVHCVFFCLQSDKKRDSATVANEIVACTTCGPNPCTHSANNGCATEVLVLIVECVHIFFVMSCLLAFIMIYVNLISFIKRGLTSYIFKECRID